ncbi:MAG: copper amine oxidase N-terminal domain-containing protein [Clostridiales bacterium]|jgi:hypothetical protein|nr:copper amine oxidase N-terminal domain-containing protein [Clostridiales bacterium]
MKKARFLLAAALVISLLFASQALAADEISVVLDGQLLSFDAPPQIISDRTMVPLRGIFESMGAVVLWNSSTRTVTAVRGANAVKLKIGDSLALVNKSPVAMDVPATIENDRTLVPLRFITESLGGEVVWDGDTKTVSITSDSSYSSDPGENLSFRMLLENAWFEAGTQNSFKFDPEDFTNINESWPDGTDRAYYYYTEGNIMELKWGSGETINDHYFEYNPQTKLLTEYLLDDEIAFYNLTGDSPVQPKTAKLYTVFSENPSIEGQITQSDYSYTGDLTARLLSDGLSNLTNLDFYLSEVNEVIDGVRIDWSPASTLVSGLDSRQQKEEFFFYTSDSLSWFMMDSLMYTLKENLGYKNVYYTMDGGKALRLPGTTPPITFPVDIPYLGSKYYQSDSNLLSSEQLS